MKTELKFSPRYNWVQREASTSSRTESIIKSTSPTRVVEQLLRTRDYAILDPVVGDFGITSSHNRDKYKKGIDRIIEQIKAKKPILVYGDSDVDGVSATAVMVRTLEAIVGEEVKHVIPSRLTDGYGVTVPLVEKTLEGEDPSSWLIVTVDCGTNDTEAINTLVDKGYNFVVTDHHLPSDPNAPLPNCIVVNPKLLVDEKDDEYELSGCYVAAKVALSVMEELAPTKFDHYANVAHVLVSLTTMSDCILINDTARREFLAARYNTDIHPGLRILFRECRATDGQPIGTQFLNFYVNPKLNSAGRMGIPEIAYKLLAMYPPENGDEVSDWYSYNGAEVYGLVANLMGMNNERKKIEEGVMGEALEMVHSDPDTHHTAVVVCKDSWHLGVCGIAAARMVELLGVPVLTIAGSEDGILKGSGRAPDEYDLHGIMERCKEHLTQFGGHRGAVGFSLRPDQLVDFSNKFREETAKSERVKPELLYDATVKIKEMYDIRNLLAVDTFEPYGRGNLPVHFRIDNVRVVGMNKSRGSQFLFLEDPEDGATLSVALFRGNISHELEGHYVSVVICVNPLYFTGLASLEYKLIDMEVPK